MATEIAKAYVQIIPSTEGMKGEIEKSLGGEAENAGKSAGSKFSGAFGNTAKLAGVALGAVTAATGATVAVMSSAISSTAAYGDEIDKASQKLGVSSSFYQEWDAVLQHSGTSMSSMSASFKTLANASQDASKDQQAAFEALGLSMEQVQSMSTEDLFKSVISGLQGMEEGTERTAIATDLLGRGSMELGALFNTTAEDTQAMLDTVNKLGGVMSNDAIKASARYQDSMQDLQTVFSGLKNNLAAEFLPGIADVMDGLTELFSGGNGVGKIKDGITSIATSIQDALPKIKETINQLMPIIVETITMALPMLMECGASILTALADAIITSLPELAKSGVEIILQIATSIADGLPELIPTIVDVLLTIVDTLIDNIDLLVDASIALMTGLAEGIINALPKLIEKVPEILIKLCDALVENAPKLLEAGLKFIVTLAKAVVDNIPKLLAKVPEVVTKLVTSFINLKEKMKEIGDKFIDRIKTAISEKWNNMITNVAGWVNNLKTSFLNKVEEFKQIGSDIVEKIKSAIGDAWNGLKEKASGWTNELKDKFSPSAFSDVGKQIVEGIKSGITSGWKALTDLVQEKAKSLLSAAKKTLGIKSPSREFANEVGQWIPAGVAMGIDNAAHLMNEAIDDALESTIPDALTVTNSVIAEQAPIQRSYEYNQPTVEKASKGITQVFNFGREVASPAEMARNARIEAQYGLMKGVALGY